MNRFAACATALTAWASPGRHRRWPVRNGSTPRASSRLAHIPLTGVTGDIQVEGKDWNMSMAAMGAALSDSDLAAVLTYIRSSWGNKGGAVTADDVKTVRAALARHPQPMSGDADDEDAGIIISGAIRFLKSPSARVRQSTARNRARLFPKRAGRIHRRHFPARHRHFAKARAVLSAKSATRQNAI